jgi:hypothetical protein
MSLWRRTRTEVAGAWRSLRYDMGRRPAAPPPPRRPGMDVTSTGMSTFGMAMGDLTGGYDEDLPRRPRRLVAVCAFAVLAVLGGVGSYFAVVHGLGPALAGEQPPAAAQPRRFPLTAAGEPAENEGLGRGTPVRAPAAPRTDDPVKPAVKPTEVKVAARPTTPVTHPATGCACLTPPVPTPTAPSGSPSPTPSTSPSASPSASGSASASSSASPSASSSETVEGRKRHPRHY